MKLPYRLIFLTLFFVISSANVTLAEKGDKGDKTDEVTIHKPISMFRQVKQGPRNQDHVKDIYHQNGKKFPHFLTICYLIKNSQKTKGDIKSSLGNK